MVCETLLRAAKEGKVFHVYVTESRPDNSGEKMINKLTAAGIKSTLILDGAAG